MAQQTPMEPPAAPADNKHHTDDAYAARSGSCGECTTTDDLNGCIAPPVPRLLTVDANWIALAWAPSTWAVVSDVPLGQRYRVLVANLTSPEDPRLHDLHAYHCCYEGIGTSTQVRRGAPIGQHVACTNRWSVSFPDSCTLSESARPSWPCTTPCTSLTSACQHQPLPPRYPSRPSSPSPLSSAPVPATACTSGGRTPTGAHRSHTCSTYVQHLQNTTAFLTQRYLYRLITPAFFTKP